MLRRFKSWHSGLSTIGKVVLWSITAVLMGTAITSASTKPSQPVPPTVTVQQQPKNNGPVTTSKTVTETEAIAFSQTTVNDSNLSAGTTKIQTVGVDGVKTLTYKITYEDKKQTDKKLIKEEVTTPAVNEVTAIGTKVASATPAPTSTYNCDPNYTPCITYVSGNGLNCGDIKIMVTVIGTDHNKFDADNDGYGCESYK